MQENTDQNNSEYGHFLRSDLRSIYILCPGALVAHVWKICSCGNVQVNENL